MTDKTLKNTDGDGASKNVRDIKFWGDKDTFQLMNKAFSEEEGWMKSTKAMNVGVGCVVQVTTQQRNPDGSYAVAEAVTFVPGVVIVDNQNRHTGMVESRVLMSPEQYKDFQGVES